MHSHLLALSAAAAGLAGVSAYAERRRMHRADPDRVGFMPWSAVLVVAVMVAIVSAALALALRG